MSKKQSVETSYGKARQLLRETGIGIENNQFVFTLAEWEAIDNEVAQLEEENTALKRYAVLLDKWFDAGELPVNVTRAIGKTRAECADALLTEEDDE